MNGTLAKLKECGCDIDGALARTLNDSDFLLHCMKAALAEPEFGQLGIALKKQDAKEAFEYAHALKGVVANVGLTPLYDCVVKNSRAASRGQREGT